ncbi:MAG TPA: hypothetical protein VKF36_10205 [Syntrophorhabdales bacterium]|nr:hypothetical protein [Syntrophorhabdales bacterium]
MRYVQNFLLNLIILLFAPASLFAGPVLVCDPYPVTELQPTRFVVVLDGTSRDVLPEQYPDGSSRLNHDLGEIADGVHTVKVKAVNSVANPQSPLESAWVAISFMKTGSQIVRTKDESEKLPPTRTFKGYLRDEH